MNYLAKYVLSASIIALSVYLKSPAVAMSLVAYWAVNVAENIFTKSSKDAEIVALKEEMAKLQREHKTLSMEITNVAERAKTVLGEVY